MTLSQARRRFKKWVRSCESDSEAARMLGCTKGAICHIMNGRRDLGLRLALKFQQIDPEVPADVWIKERSAA
jgi:hypothetical protein